MSVGSWSDAGTLAGELSEQGSGSISTALRFCGFEGRFEFRDRPRELVEDEKCSNLLEKIRRTGSENLRTVITMTLFFEHSINPTNRSPKIHQLSWSFSTDTRVQLLGLRSAQFYSRFLSGCDHYLI